MKTKLSIFLVFILCVAFACGDNKIVEPTGKYTQEQFYGKWIAKAISHNGKEWLPIMIPIDALQGLIYLDLKADGSFSFAETGDSDDILTGTWVLYKDKIIATTNDYKINFQIKDFEGDKLTVKISYPGADLEPGMWFKMSKSAEE